ncbi:fusion protein [Brazilian porcupinepox virus 1]|nr:fusion protein [Brazilian porcupinepox virus 1]
MDTLTVYPGDDEDEVDMETRGPLTDTGKTNEITPSPPLPVLPIEDNETIKKDIMKIMKSKYPSLTLTDNDIDSILNDVFIKKDNIDIKDFILRLMVLEKLFTSSVYKCISLEKTIKRIENHTETIRKNMLLLAKKIDFQTNRM